MKKKILIHSIAFSPDGVSTAYLYNDIAVGLKNSGFEVVILTTTPHYNIVQSELEKQPLRKYWGGLFYKSNFHGIEVYHVPQKKFKKASLRIIGFIYWHLLTFLIGLFQFRVSLILSPSPPLTIGFISILIAKCKRAKAIYNVQEIYPDFLINQGNLTSKPVIILLRWLERFVYRHSDAVTTIDEVFYKTIVDRIDDLAKLVIIRNFVDTDIYRPLGIDAALSLDQALFPQKDVLKVMYAGNIGHAQDWKPLLQVAVNISDFPVEFWVIGEGVVKDTLRKEIEEKKLRNIHLLPYQPRDIMPAIAGYADLHFIFMNPQMEGQGFPSKVYTIMACKKPLIIASGENTPLYNFLNHKQCAFLIAETEFNKKCAGIEAILRNLGNNKSLVELFGETGYDIIRQSYTKEIVIKQYADLCMKLIG